MPPYRIIALGDSLTYGYPYGKSMSWVALTAKELGIPILNQGINGNTLQDLKRRMTFDVLDMKPEFSIVMGGTNDLYQGIELKQMQEHLTNIVNALERENIKPILGLPPPIQNSIYEKKLEKFRRWLKRLARERNLSTIDFYSCFFQPRKKNLISSLLEDEVHPNSTGYAAMAGAALHSLSGLINTPHAKTKEVEPQN